MKKIISIISIIIIITLGTISYAVEENNSSIEVNLVAPKTIEEGTTTCLVTLSLGKFKEIEEEKVVAFQTKLQYDENQIESIAVKGINNWTLSYAKESNMLIGDISKIKSNQEIGQIEITLKDNLKVGEKIKIELKEMLFVSGNTEIKLEKAIEVEIVEKTVEALEETTKNKEEAMIQDTTIANKIIPAAGIGQLIVIAIIVILILAGIFKFKSRKIKY